MWGLDYIKSEWHVVKGAPLAFALLLVAGLIGGYAFESILTAERVATLETMIRQRDGEIDGYQKTLSDRMDKVEKALSAQQLSSIETTLTRSPTATVELQSDREWTDTAEIARQLQSTFEKTGWTVDKSQGKSGAGVVLRATSDVATSVIRNALDEAAVPYKTTPISGPTGGMEFMLYKHSSGTLPKVAPDTTQP
ncbi:hypothetical protein [Mesorhizobium sp. M0187]|uniref:hypothetical protein n=1 Tax=Mesorhizobium sp. M0187 TaxID=2956908 RepID=UPI00333BE854